jgi:archaellum component FlaF (FlaF/FlaG flagellin family)
LGRGIGQRILLSATVLYVMSMIKRLLTLMVLTGAVALPVANAAASSPTLIRAHSGKFVATLKISTKTPKINASDAITVTATSKGKSVRALASYQFLFGGSVVSTQYPFNNKHFAFTGHYQDSLSFPASSLGFPLTLRVVVRSGGHVVDLDCAITSHK